MLKVIFCAAAIAAIAAPAGAATIGDWQMGLLGTPQVAGQQFEFINLSGTPAAVAQFKAFNLAPQNVGLFIAVDANNPGTLISSPGSITLEYKTTAPSGTLFDHAGGSFNILGNGTGLFQAWSDAINGANLVVSGSGPLIDIPDIYNQLFVRNTITLNNPSALSSATNAYTVVNTPKVPEKGMGLALLAVAGMFGIGACLGALNEPT